jgi:hypothetical protein
MKGYCRCGQVQFEVTSGPLITMACHCTGCQRMTASAYSLSALYWSEHFKVTQGDPVIGAMSWLFTRPEGMDQFVNIRATMMDDARSFVPFIEIYTDEMLPWATTAAVHRFEKFPPREGFPDLIAEYAQQRR